LAKRNLLILSILLFALSACSEQEKLALVLESYVNYSENDLLNNFGHPSDTIMQGNNKIHYYGFSRRVYNPPLGYGFGTGFYGRRGMLLGPSYYGVGSYTTYQCNISFKVDQRNIVENWNLDGNSCARYSKRKLVNPKFITDLPKLTEKVYGFKYKKTRKGIKVTSILEESIAYKNGLRKGDIIKSINSKDMTKLPVEYANDELNYNDKVTIVYERDGKQSLLSFPKTRMQKLELYPKSLKNFLGFAKG
jgi:membrane-associated protease RseP (regulator of RpoE activity)